MALKRLEPLEKDYYLAFEDEEENLNAVGEEEEEEEEDEKKTNEIGETSNFRKKKRDEFEMDMEAELDVAFSDRQNAWIPGMAKLSENLQKKKKKSRGDDVDESLGIDDHDTESDEEFRCEEGLIQPTNDELFYDPKEDQDNQDWIDSHRRSYHSSKQKQGSKMMNQKLPNSDAVLNCPACMTTLCLDCQRHEIYRTQYRAMFVMNCIVNSEQTLNFPLKTTKKKRKENIEKNGEKIQESKDVFHPIFCEICKTEVGVQDNDEVFHFFNVLASY